MIKLFIFLQDKALLILLRKTFNFIAKQVYILPSHRLNETVYLKLIGHFTFQLLTQMPITRHYLVWLQLFR